MSFLAHELEFIEADGVVCDQCLSLLEVFLNVESVHELHHPAYFSFLDESLNQILVFFDKFLFAENFVFR